MSHVLRPSFLVTMSTLTIISRRRVDSLCITTSPQNVCKQSGGQRCHEL